jgi:hypothetical protein
MTAQDRFSRRKHLPSVYNAPSNKWGEKMTARNLPILERDKKQCEIAIANKEL